MRCLLKKRFRLYDLILQESSISRLDFDLQH
jgi:hypothetical protein